MLGYDDGGDLYRCRREAGGMGKGEQGLLYRMDAGMNGKQRWERKSKLP